MPTGDLVKIEVVRLPKIYIVGKEIRYSDEALNSGDNRLPGLWDRCYKENAFAPLEAQPECLFDISHAGVFIDWYLGDGDFSYIVGMLMKEGAAIPGGYPGGLPRRGYTVRELGPADAAHCWIKCKSLTETRAAPSESTAKAIKDIGRDCTGMKWCIDLYHYKRSTEPDENGDVILDCYIPLD